MSRMISIPNLNHPVHMLNNCGFRAKQEARKLSNKQLDKLLSDNLQNPEELKEVLAWTRGRKIKFIRHCAMRNFAKRLEDVNNPKLEETKAVENGE